MAAAAEAFVAEKHQRLHTQIHQSPPEEPGVIQRRVDIAFQPSTQKCPVIFLHQRMLFHLKGAKAGLRSQGDVLLPPALTLPRDGNCRV